jgi:hypothetical protein
MQKPKTTSNPKMASTLNQHRLAVAIKFSVIGVVIVALYIQDLSMIFSGALVDEASFHISRNSLLVCLSALSKTKND